ncbi:MAG: hypothetical protein U1E50_08675 [Caulobacteraceae bacterium]
MSYPDRLQTTFGVSELPHALALTMPHAARFELGGDIPNIEDPARRFLQAIDRARRLCRLAFAESAQVEVLLSLYGPALLGPRERRILRRLNRAGFDSSSLKPLGSTLQHDADYAAEFGSDLHRHWFGAVLTGPEADIDRLLWCAIADEMPIEPSSPVDIYFVDFERRLIVHPYDDRGLDIAAGSATDIAKFKG